MPSASHPTTIVSQRNSAQDLSAFGLTSTSSTIQNPACHAYPAFLCRAVGIEADSERVELLLKELDGKDVNDVIAEGLTKLASVPSGGGGGGGGGGAAAASGGGAAAEKVEEKKVEEEEEEDEVRKWNIRLIWGAGWR